jgi:hypothetical protein
VIGEESLEACIKVATVEALMLLNEASFPLQEYRWICLAFSRQVTASTAFNTRRIL